MTDREVFDVARAALESADRIASPHRRAPRGNRCELPSSPRTTSRWSSKRSDPGLGPHDVLVHIDASGVCHSDLSRRQRHAAAAAAASSSATRAPAPCSRSAPRSPACRSATASIASFIPACGNCFFCLHDQSQPLRDDAVDVMMPKAHARRRQRRASAMTGLGTFADEMTFDESIVVKVETDLPDEQLALIGCGVTTGVGAALNTAQVEPGLHRRRHRLRRRRARPSSRARASPARSRIFADRPGRDEAQDRRAARRHRPRRPRRRATRSRRCRRSPAAAAPTTRSR